VTADRTREALERTAASAGLAGLSARVYQLDDHRAPALEVRLGPAHRKPGWSTHAVLELPDPAVPNLGLITVLDRRDDDGLPCAGPRDPVLTIGLDARFVRRFIHASRTTLSGLDPTGGSRSVAVIRNPGRTTLADALIVPFWVVLLLRGCAWRTQLALVIVDFAGFERTARTMTRLVGRHRLHLFAATARTSASLRLPGHVLEFSTATDQGVAVALRYLAQHRDGDRP
jgi:hypothetical protein